MKLVNRLIDWVIKSLPHGERVQKNGSVQATLTTNYKAPHTSVSENDSQDFPLRFHANLSPETPLAFLLRNGEVALSGAHDKTLERHGTWELVSNRFGQIPMYYSHSQEKWVEIDKKALLDYLKELRRIVEAPLPNGASDLDVAIQRARQLESLPGVRSYAWKDQPGSTDTPTDISCYDHFFQSQFNRALTFILKTLNVPSTKGLTTEHLLALHEKGLRSIDEILNAPDALMLSISGIGPKRLAIIRANLRNDADTETPNTPSIPHDYHITVPAPDRVLKGLPPLRFSFADDAVLQPSQRSFFKELERELGLGRRVEVGEDVGYLYLYCYRILISKDADVILPALSVIRELYPEDIKLSSRCAEWISDTYAINGRYEEALESFPVLQLSSRAGIPTSKKLSLRLVLGSEPDPTEVLTLFGPKVTRFVREELDLVERYIGVLLREHNSHENRRLLDQWAEHSKRDAHGYPFYLGSILGNNHEELPFYWFCVSTLVEEFCLEVTRDAENAIRGDRGLPGVGEGWISETRLYYEVKEALPDRKVVPHASPSWLGRQHLDIFLPEDLVAIEFQGEQHDKPIDFFGGVKAFEENIKRDRRKKRLCEENGVCLIYVREGYVLEEVVEAIRTRSGVKGEVP